MSIPGEVDHTIKAMAIAEHLRDTGDCTVCDMTELNLPDGGTRRYHAEDCWYRQYVLAIFGGNWHSVLRVHGIYPYGEEDS